MIDTREPTTDTPARPGRMDGTFGAKEAFNELIIILAVMQMITSQLAEPFRIAQRAIEIALFISLALGISRKHIKIIDYYLVIVLIEVTIISFFYVDYFYFFANAKHNFLAALSLIYFSYTRHKSKAFLLIFFAASSITVLNRFYPEISYTFSLIAKDPHFNLSRFGGIFLNTHFNAFFMGAAIIALTNSPVPRIMGGALIYITASKFIFAAYMADFISKLFSGIFTVTHRLIIVIILLASAMLVILSLPIFYNSSIEFLLKINQNSLAVIISQILDFNYYFYFLNIIPNSYFHIDSNTVYKFSFHDGQNEIGFFSLSIYSGTIFGYLFLFILLSRSPKFAVFILFSLFHNLFIMYPIMIYIFVQYGFGRIRGEV
jgi:hypothetical protein